MKATSKRKHVRVRAKMACFTLPEFKTERCSSVAAPVSTWDGVLSQVQGHRGVHYEIESAAMLFEPRKLAQTVNEVRDFGTGKRGPVNTEDQRTLRTTTYLAGRLRTIHKTSFEGDLVSEPFAGVDFVVTYRLTTRDPQELVEHEDMLDRRLRNGHFWRTPGLGLRELIADVEPIKGFSDAGLILDDRTKAGRVIPYPSDIPLYTHSDGLKTFDYNADLGFSFFGIDWDDPSHPHYFAPLRVEHGLLKYPSWDEVRSLGISRKGTR